MQSPLLVFDLGINPQAKCHAQPNQARVLRLVRLRELRLDHGLLIEGLNLHASVTIFSPLAATCQTNHLTNPLEQGISKLNSWNLAA
jgi:hypothetical protein